MGRSSLTSSLGLLGLFLLAGGEAAGLPYNPPSITTIGGENWIVLSWNAHNEYLGTTAYEIYRSTYPGLGTLSWSGNLPVDPSDPMYPANQQLLDYDGTRSFWDVGVTAGGEYYYTIRSIGDGFNDSTTVLGTPVVSASAFGDVALSPGDGWVRLNWTIIPDYPGEKGVSTYRIFRATHPGSFNPGSAHKELVDVGSYLDEGLTNLTPYYYMMFPCYPAREPSFCYAIPFKAPSPGGRVYLSLDSSGPRTVRLSWDPAVPGDYGTVTSYAVYRSDDGGATMVALSTVVGSLSYVDTVPAYGKRYVYLVRPVDSMGNLGNAYPLAIIDIALPSNRLFLNRNKFRPGRAEALSVTFQLVEPGWARISVYSLGGEVIRRLCRENYQGDYTVDSPLNSAAAGIPPIIWDGANDRGSLVGSGVYLVVLEINRSRDIRKIAVIR